MKKKFFKYLLGGTIFFMMSIFFHMALGYAKTVFIVGILCLFCICGFFAFEMRKTKATNNAIALGCLLLFILIPVCAGVLAALIVLGTCFLA